MLLDAFVLARDIREVDMRASPYDVSAFTGSDGNELVPVAIETPAGKREYTTLQRGFAEQGDALRLRVLHAIKVARETLADGAATAKATATPSALRKQSALGKLTR